MSFRTGIVRACSTPTSKGPSCLQRALSGTMLSRVLVALIVAACTSISPSMSQPSPSQVSSSADASPAETPGLTFDCGPLASDPNECRAAIAAAIQLLRPLKPSQDYTLVQLQPEPTCTPPCGFPPPVIVRGLRKAGGIHVAEVHLRRTNAGWTVVGIAF